MLAEVGVADAEEVVGEPAVGFFFGEALGGLLQLGGGFEVGDGLGPLSAFVAVESQLGIRQTMAQYFSKRRSDTVRYS